MWLVLDHCDAETPCHISPSMPLLMEGGFYPKSHNAWPHSFIPSHGSVVLVPLQKESPKAQCFQPHPIHSRYGILWTQLSILSPPNPTSLFISSFIVTKKVLFWLWNFSQFYSGSFKCSVANFRWARTCTGFKERDTSGTWSLWWHSVVMMVTFGTLVPVLCSSFTRPPCGVLGFLVIIPVIIFYGFSFPHFVWQTWGLPMIKNNRPLSCF